MDKKKKKKFVGHNQWNRNNENFYFQRNNDSPRRRVQKKYDKQELKEISEIEKLQMNTTKHVFKKIDLEIKNFSTSLLNLKSNENLNNTEINEMKLEFVKGNGQVKKIIDDNIDNFLNVVLNSGKMKEHKINVALKAFGIDYYSLLNTDLSLQYKEYVSEFKENNKDNGIFNLILMNYKEFRKNEINLEVVDHIKMIMIDRYTNGSENNILNNCISTVKETLDKNYLLEFNNETKKSLKQKETIGLENDNYKKIRMSDEDNKLSYGDRQIKVVTNDIKDNLLNSDLSLQRLKEIHNFECIMRSEYNTIEKIYIKAIEEKKVLEYMENFNFKNDINKKLNFEKYNTKSIFNKSNEQLENNVEFENKFNLGFLFLQNNKIKNVNLNNLENLEILYLQNNKFENIDLKMNLNLLELRINDNNLKSIDLTNNINIETISCYNNQIELLDLSKNEKINNLLCDSKIKILLNPEQDNFNYLKSQSIKLGCEVIEKNMELNNDDNDYLVEEQEFKPQSQNQSL